MRYARRLALWTAAVALAPALLAASAGASYDNGFDAVPGALLISADYSRHEQGDDTTKFATVSTDGRYVAIETFSRNFFADNDPDPPGRYRAGGLFRFDLQTRALQKIADGNLFEEGGENKFLQRGASNPSISADGRFVAFSTAERLVPADGNENVDAYVRDMGLPLPAGGTCAEPSPPCPFRLVSARDGSEVPASYGAAGSPVPGGAPGAEVSRGVAISADGQRVAFRTEAPSDLPAASGATVPAGQVFVRDLAAKTTALISEELDPASGLMTEQPAGGALGAAISGDGSAVAWTGRNAPAQTRFVAGENTDANFNYYLWRRVAAGPEAPLAAGPAAPTRRITGLADPDDPVCRQQEEANPGMTTNFDSTSTGPCFGPLTDQEANRSDISSQLPALSRDGYTVAFLTGAGPRPITFTGPGLDLYVTRMNPGLSRKQATAELTRDTASFEPAISSPISSVAISADGRYLALTTSRTQFTLPVLQMAGAPRAVAGPHELYLIDLGEHTIERAAHSTAGGDINGEVQDGVSLSADGARIAFTSFAGNLFLGDSNQRTDAFVVTREDESASEGGAGGKAAAGQQLDRNVRQRAADLGPAAIDPRRHRGAERLRARCGPPRGGRHRFGPPRQPPGGDRRRQGASQGQRLHQADLAPEVLAAENAEGEGENSRPGERCLRPRGRGKAPDHLPAGDLLLQIFSTSTQIVHRPGAQIGEARYTMLAPPPAAASPEESLQIANIEIRPAELQVLVDGTRSGLTVREFELFLLAKRLDSVVQRPEIYELMWGGEMPRRDRSVDVLVRKVRGKLEAVAPDWRYIHTHFGIGYRFTPEAIR